MTEPAIATPNQSAQATPARKTPAGAQGNRPDGTRRGELPAARTSVAPRTGWLAFVALLWLLAALLINRVSLSGGSGDYNLVLAATGLPLLVQASTLAGTAAGQWTVVFAAARRPRLGERYPRLGVGLLAGLLTGGLASGAVLIAYGIPASAATVLAVCVSVAGGIGGLLGTLRPSSVIAGVTAGLAVMIIGYVVSQFNGALLPLFGGTGNSADRFAANGLLAGATALVMGIVAGLVGYLVLRRVAAQVGEAPHWPAFLVAGGSAGIVLGLAEVFSRIGVPLLLSMAAQEITIDRLFQAMAAGSRLNTFMVVFFVGAVTSMIAFGRSLPRRTD